MIKITNTKVLNNIPAYEVSSDKGMTIKNIHTGKELPKFISIIEPKASDYTETTRTVDDYNKEQKYNTKVEELIRLKYSVSDELAILRQQNIKPKEFEEYDKYCEQCKAEARRKIYKEV